jgi:hypothetical protein
MEENDLIVKTDRHYTQGIKLAYLFRDEQMPAAVHNLSEAWKPLGYSRSADKFGLSIGQNIYTPSDTDSTELLEHDRPYAGWLYVGLILQRRGQAAHWAAALESVELQLGVIGPESLAEQAQTWIHEVRGFAVPRGWDNQIHTEPGVALRYSRVYRLSPNETVARFVDMLPEAGFSLGNAETSVRAGAVGRLGVNLPDDFGLQTINSLRSPEGGWSETQRKRAWGFYAFAGVEGWAVAHTAFLDGNLFRDSHSVEKEPFIVEWKAGFAVVLKRFEVGFTFAERTREFEQQPEGDSYGSAFLKVRF